MTTKRDYAVVALIGFLAGVFAIPTLVNLGAGTKLFLILLPIFIPLLFLLGIWIGGALSRFLPFLSQFSRFVAVGFLNTAIDFGILNILSILTGIASGFIVGGVNVPGFIAAVFNSYAWNKLWVFRDHEPESFFHDFPKFMAVTIIGLLINSLIVVATTTYVAPLVDLNREAWLNIAKVLATIISMVWNFAGYKFLVFRK